LKEKASDEDFAAFEDLLDDPDVSF